MLLGVRKRKRVSWASDGNLCQVRLFLSEDYPSQAGKGFHEYMQPKKRSLNCTGSAYHGFWPLGFEGVSADVQLSTNTHMKWKCPSRFLLNASWQVVAGEESEEVKMQNERELRMLEQIYPDSSAIPSNPITSLDTNGSTFDDNRTPLVPVIPIEEDEAVCKTSADPTPSDESWATSLSSGSAQASYATTMCAPNLPDNEVLTALSNNPQLLAAASAMLSALVPGNEQEKRINHDFLAKIFSDPDKLAELVKSQNDTRIGSRVEVQDAKRAKFDSNGEH